MTKTNKTLMTAALGGLLIAATLTSASAEEKGSADGAKMGECHGVNSCKGTSACTTDTSSCSGQNSCKGKGWLKMSKADCEAKGGKFKE